MHSVWPTSPVPEATAANHTQQALVSKLVLIFPTAATQEMEPETSMSHALAKANVQVLS